DCTSHGRTTTRFASTPMKEHKRVCSTLMGNPSPTENGPGRDTPLPIGKKRRAERERRLRDWEPCESEPKGGLSKLSRRNCGLDICARMARHTARMPWCGSSTTFRKNQTAIRGLW